MDLTADELAELRALIPELMGPALPELRAFDKANVTIDLLLLHARRRLNERLIEPAREMDAIETARSR